MTSKTWTAGTVIDSPWLQDVNDWTYLISKKMICPYIPEFGVVGDNSTDDTVALNAALTYAGTVGGCVVIRGKHKISGTILVPDGAALVTAVAIQASRVSTADVIAGASLICTGTAGTYDAVTLGSTTGFLQASIVGIGIFCGFIANQGINVQNGAASIIGCAVNRSKTHGITVNRSVCMIQNTHVLYAGRNGIQILSGDCQIQGHCEVQQPNNVGAGETAGTYSCFYVTGGTLQMSGGRSGDDLFRCKHNIEVVGGAGIQVTNWDVSQSPKAGIHLTNCTGAVITGNKFISGTTDANSAGIVIAGTSSIIHISGNVFNNTAAAGLGAINIDPAMATPSYIHIVGNTVFGPWSPTSVTATSNFIKITDAQKAAAVGCRFENAQYPQAISPQFYDISGSATPTILPPQNGFAPNCYYLANGGATTITAINGGYPGQMIVLESANSNTTIQHGSGLELLSRSDWTMQNGGMLFLVRTATAMTGGARWIELGRKDGGTTGANVNGVSLGGTLRVFQGTGSPAGVQFGTTGDLYINKSGGAGTTFYVKESGTNTSAGWAAK